MNARTRTHSLTLARTHAVITANVGCNRLKLTSDSFTGPAPGTVADTWMDSFQVGWIQKLWPCGKLLAVAGRTKRALRRCLLFARGSEGESEEEPGLKGSGGAAAAKRAL